MLSNAYLLAKIGADTAENEQQFAEILPTDALSDVSGGGRRGPRGPAVRRAARAGRRRRTLHRGPSSGLGVRVSKIGKISRILQIFLRARSRLYQNETLQENMRWTAFFKLYKICTLLHRCNLKIFAKNRFEKSAFFVKIQQKLNFANVAKFANFCHISKISA